MEEYDYLESDLSREVAWELAGQDRVERLVEELMIGESVAGDPPEVGVEDELHELIGRHGIKRKRPSDEESDLGCGEA